MEVRGIGVINISSIFGVGSVRSESGSISFSPKRLGGEEKRGPDRARPRILQILGIKIPHVIIPVKKGRDLGRLVEVAALDRN
jgi:HPr kinase/phosphorylase